MSTAEGAGASVDNSRLGRKARFALILGGLTAFGPLSIDMYVPALPQLTADLGATSSAAQLTLTAVLLGLGFGQLVAGPVSDSVGRRKPLMTGLAVYILASVLCALSGSVYALAALRFLQGFGAAAGMVIARASVRDLYSGVEVARFFSALMLVTGLAPILAPVIGGQVLTYTNWRGVFVVLTVFAVVLMGGLPLSVAVTVRANTRCAPTHTEPATVTAPEAASMAKAPAGLPAEMEYTMSALAPASASVAETWATGDPGVASSRMDTL